MRTTRDRMLTTRNSKALRSFVEYCESQPDLRFWQALRIWAGYQFIYAANNSAEDGDAFDYIDTYSWEGRRHGEQS